MSGYSYQEPQLDEIDEVGEEASLLKIVWARLIRWASHFPRWTSEVRRELRATVGNKNKKVDIILLGLVLALLSFGLVMLYSASYANASINRGDSGYFIKRQLVFAAIGLVLMLIMSYFPAERLKETWWFVLTVSYILLIVVLFIKNTESGDDGSGDIDRWIKIGGVSVQPSEITKLAIIMSFAYFGWKMPDMKKQPFKSLIPYGIVLGSNALLMILQPHLSGTILILLIGATIVLVNGVDMKWFLGIVLVGCVALFFLVYFDVGGYWMERIEVWIDPESDPLGAGWQNIQAMYAMASGGLFGQGFGNSRQKYLYISAPQNDFIFAVICEELGFVGAVFILALFLIFVWRGFSISMTATGRYQKLLGIGITSQIGWQALLNIAVVTRAVPNTGISLPFFSYGGSSLIMILFEMGMLLSISRSSTIKKT